MEVTSENTDDALFINAIGRLDFNATDSFQEQLEALIGPEGPAAKVIVVDCSALDYVASAGLRVFIMAAKTAKGRGLAFGVCSLTPGVDDIFEVSGLASLIPVGADRTAIVEQLGRS